MERNSSLKTCWVCHKAKPFSEFYPRHARCKKCNYATAHAHRERLKKEGTYTAYRFREGLKRKYGMTPEQWEEIFERQGKACAICKNTDPCWRAKSGKANWHVDHNHQTGEVRGILCPRCNMFVGQIEKDDELLSGAFAYLYRKLFTA